jgi:hypothetical protein
MDYFCWVMMQNKVDIGKCEIFNPDLITSNLLKYDLVLQTRNVLTREDKEDEFSVSFLSDLICFPKEDIEIQISEEREEYDQGIWLNPKERPKNIIPAEWKKISKGTYIPKQFSTSQRVVKIRGKEIPPEIEVIEGFATGKAWSTCLGFEL